MKIVSDSGGDTFHVRLLHDGSSYYVRLHVYDDSDTEHATELYTISDEPTDISVEMDTEDGVVDLYINGYRVERLSSLDIDGKNPDYDVVFGNYNIDEASGSIYIDTCGYNYGIYVPLLLGLSLADFLLIAPDVDTTLVVDKEYFVLSAPGTDTGMNNWQYYTSHVARAETGDTSEFRDVDTFLGGAMTVSSSNPLRGLYSYEATVNGSSIAIGYLQHSSAYNQTRVAVSMLLDPNSITVDTDNYFYIMTDLQGYWVALAVDDGDYVVRVEASPDSGAKIPTAWYPITDGVGNEIKVSVRYSTGAGHDNGEISLFIDGELKETLTGLDNDTKVCSTAAFGTTWIADGSPGGGGEKIRFDECSLYPYMETPLLNTPALDFTLIAEES